MKDQEPGPVALILGYIVVAGLIVTAAYSISWGRFL
jgi:hypothetical protein